MSKNEHTIIDIINPKPSTYGYNFGIKINIKIYNGYYKFIPHKNDIIKCTLNDNKFNNAKFYLPNNIDHQKERIKYIKI